MTKLSGSNMYSLTITSALLVFIVIATTESKPTEDIQRVINVQACGKELSNLLASICSLGYNPQTRISSPSAPTNEDVKDNLVDNESNNISEDKRKNHKAGVIHECCRQPCRWQDLLAYCHNGSSANSELFTDKLKSLRVKVVKEDPYTVFLQPADVKPDSTPTKNNEVYRTRTVMKFEGMQPVAKDLEVTKPKTTPTTGDKSKHIVSHGGGLNSHIKSITPYHYHKTPIIVDNRPLTIKPPPQV